MFRQTAHQLSKWYLKMPNIDTLDALSDEMTSTLNILWTHSQISKTFLTDSPTWIPDIPFDIHLLYPWYTLKYPWNTLDIAWWYAQDLTKSQKLSFQHGAFLSEAENLSNFRVILEEGLQFLRFFPSMCAIRICGWWKHFWSPWAQHSNCNQDWTKAV